MTVVDTHVHVIQPPSADRPYDPAGRPVDPLLAEDLMKEAAAAGVDKVVQVTPSTLGYDNRYSLEAADQFPDFFSAVVIRFDPFTPDLEQRLLAATKHPKVIGVRFTLTTPDSREWLREGVLEPFFKVAEKTDVVAQLFAPHKSADMKTVARRYPKLRILVDHTAVRYEGKGNNANIFGDWPNLIELGQEPNVWIKCSYFPEAVMDMEKYPFPTAQQYFKQLYDGVDATRLIWGGNYPPVTHACTYKQAVDFALTECKFMSPKDREAILGGNFLKTFGR